MELYIILTYILFFTKEVVKMPNNEVYLLKIFKEVIISFFCYSIGIFIAIWAIGIETIISFLDNIGLANNTAYIVIIGITLLLLLIYSIYMVINGEVLKINRFSEKINLEKKELIRKSSEIKKYYDIKKTKANSFFEKVYQEFRKVVGEEIISKPYFAQIYADYIFYLDIRIADYLESKSRPAVKASEEIRLIAKEKRDLFKKLKVLENQLSIYENIFPWLEEFKEINLTELEQIINFSNNSEEYEELRTYISPKEYNSLSNVEKYQLALDRYKEYPNKTNWQIGIEFERYIGYLYEEKGYYVTYYGALKGFGDLGRDLIIEKGKEIKVIQCKNWSKKKTIHEKHIFQLFGSMVLLQLEYPNKNIKGEFITTTSLSEVSKQVAKKLNIIIIENYIYDKQYPCIKCNISKRDGTKIYHLPFDQQYDKVHIEMNRGEFYASTILDAEEKGFRRAYRWRGDGEFPK